MTSDDIKVRNNKTSRAHPIKRNLFTLLILSLLTTIVVLMFIYIGRIFPQGPQEKKKLEITVSPSLPSTTTRPVISIDGSLPVRGQVTVYLDDFPLGQTTTRKPLDYEQHDSNPFEFKKIGLRPGANHLRLTAKTLDADGQQYSTVPLDRMIEWIPSTSEEPAILLSPYTIANDPNLSVQGLAYPQSRVFIKILSSNSDNTSDRELVPANLKETGECAIAQADEQGRFQADIKFANPGKYVLVAGSDPYKQFTESTWELPRIIYDPFRAFKATISMGYDQTIIDFEATLDKNSPQAVGLITGAHSLPQFIDEVCGLSLEDGPIAYDFWDVTPTITTSNGATTVKATTTSSRGGNLPVFNGPIAIRRQIDYQYDYFPILGMNENLSIKFDDYLVQSYYPIPDDITDGVATWAGNRAATDFTGDIQVGLSYNPFSSPAKLFRFLSLSPYQLFGYKISRAFNLFYGFLYTVPILWTLWLLYKYREIAGVPPIIIYRLRHTCHALLIIIYIAPLLSIIIDIVRGSPQRQISANYLALFLDVLILLAIDLLLLLTKSLDRKAVIFWNSRSLASIIFAAAMCLAILGFVSRFSLTYQQGNLLDSLPSIIIAFSVLLFVILCLKRLLDSLPSEHFARSKKVFLLTILLALTLAYPRGSSILSISDSGFPVSEITRANIQNFFYLIQDIMPYVLLVGIMLLLKLAHSKEEDSHPVIIGFGWILFVAYIVGSTPNWFIIPIPLLLALKLYPMGVMQPFEKRHTLNLLRERVLEQRKSLLLRVFSNSQAQQFLNSLESLKKKINSGDLMPTEFEKRKTEIEEYAVRLERESKMSYGLEVKDVALNFGPCETDWENGVYAVKFGLIIALPFLLIYLWTFFEQIRSGHSFRLLWVVLRVIAFLADWMIAAFFFGYFFPYIRGESGLKKGLHIAVTVIICLIPVWFISGSSSVELTASFLRAGQIFLFFTVLGIWAFDYRTFRDSLGQQFSWRKFTQFGDMPSLTAFASVLVTSAGIAISTVISGQFTTVVSHLVTALFPQLPNPPTK